MLLLSLVSLVGYALRANITIAQETMAPELGLTMANMGTISAWGFQLAYAESVTDLGLGHVLQWHQVQAAAAEGISLYDLGMDVAYKHRWADRIDETFAIVGRRD